MLVKQISVFVENKQGRLTEIADVLAKNDIDISALSLADSDEYGVLRLIVNKPELAKEVLKESGVIGKVTDVVAVVMDDMPGGVASALHLFTDAGLTISYMYACVSRETGKALMVVKVDECDIAEQLLERSPLGAVNPSEIYRID